MLRHAWGVWGSDEAPQTVTLRFAPGIATRRVKETIWHPLERITDSEDGGCIWEAEIAEWRRCCLGARVGGGCGGGGAGDAA